MADNVTTQTTTLATIPTGTVIATDDAGAGGHVQIVKLAISTDGSVTLIPGDAANGLDVDVTRLPALPAGTNNIGDVDVLTLPALVAGTALIGAITPRLLTTRIGVVPTISTSIYASGDNVGGEIEFTNAVRTSGATGEIRSVVLVDQDAENAPLELWLFDRAISGTHTDNSAFDPTDADLDNLVGRIDIDAAHYATVNDNSAAVVSCAVPIKSNATSIYGYLVVRSTPTYTSTTDLTVTLHIVQD